MSPILYTLCTSETMAETASRLMREGIAKGDEGKIEFAARLAKLAAKRVDKGVRLT
jgi:hypothetical protein